MYKLEDYVFGIFNSFSEEEEEDGITDSSYIFKDTSIQYRSESPCRRASKDVETKTHHELLTKFLLFDYVYNRNGNNYSDEGRERVRGTTISC